jgi:Ca2+-binding RTX toxin-like protein
MMRRTILAALVVVGLAAVGTGGALGQTAPTCFDLAPTIVGDGSGTIYGTGGADVIVHTSNVGETIYGLGGNDTICAGGHDVVYAGAGDDRVLGASSPDETYPHDTAHHVYGGSGNDYLAYSFNSYGESGNDTLEVANEMYGGSGNDTLMYGILLCDGGSGIDTAVGEPGYTCTPTVNVP